MRRCDAVVIGAGVNGLAAAILLARAGWDVAVLERAGAPGGAVRTEEVTLPGFRHDLYAANLNLFLGSRFFAEVGDDLRARGFDVVVSPRPFGSVFPDGRFVGVSTGPEATRGALAAVSRADARAWEELAERFAAVAPHLFPVLGRPMPSVAAARAVWGGMRALGRGWPFELVRLALQSSRSFVEEHFESREARALCASWGMHLDFPPDVPGGALFCFLESFASAAGGMALGRQGARTLVDSMTDLLRSAGGELVTDAEVERIVVEDGRASGVAVRGGGRWEARRAVVANLVPSVLARLVPGLAAAARRYRHGPGTMMIHLALDELPPWRAGEHVRGWSYVHVGPYLDDMARAYQEARAGRPPVRPTLVVGQPTAVDPSRAPEGKHVLWIQVRVLPPGWDDGKEAYADHVLALLDDYAPGVRDLVLARHVLSPADLERANPNLVGGDQLGGSHHPDQNFFLRPVPGWSRYRTPVAGLYLCGAATWPGAGVGAGSGYLLARQLLQKPRSRLGLLR